MPALSLADCVVIIDPSEPSFVHHAVAELRHEIEVLTGEAPRLSYAAEEAGRAAVSIVAGRASGAGLAGVAGEPPESFAIEARRSPKDRITILAAGSDAMGTSYALMHLTRLLVTRGAAAIEQPLTVRERPRYRWRGLYLHQHWRYKHPYATWSWSVEDWKHAIDVVAGMRFNLVMIWPHMDMLAPPLTPTEVDHLNDLRAVIDYAQRKRGMKVWLVEPANVLLDSPAARAAPLEERDYYAYANLGGGGLKDPSDPAQRAALRGNRAALYRHVPNADGYGFIDSDPGGWLGSPAGEFVDLLAENRALLGHHHERPAEVTLFHWVLAGWGNGTAQDAWRDTMTGVVREVAPPRAFLACFDHHLKLARKLDQLPQTLFFPYGIIDGEPSFPITGPRFDQLEKAFDGVKELAGLGGVIGNVQTFFAQLPNIYFMARMCWDASVANDTAGLMRELAGQLLPDHVEALVAGWQELEWAGHGWAHADEGAADRAAGLAQGLEEAERAALPRTGYLGRSVFPHAGRLLGDLAAMMRIHAAAQVVRLATAGGSAPARAPEAAPAPGAAEVKRLVLAYLDAMLAWQKRNGFFGTYGVDKEVLHAQYLFDADAAAVRSAIESVTLEGDRRGVAAEFIAELVARGYRGDRAEVLVHQLLKIEKPRAATRQIESVIFAKMPPAAETQPWTQPPFPRRG